MSVRVKLPSGDEVPGDFQMMQLVGEVRTSVAKSLRLSPHRVALCGTANRKLDDVETLEDMGDVDLQVVLLFTDEDVAIMERDQQSAELAVKAARRVLDCARRAVDREDGDREALAEDAEAAPKVLDGAPHAVDEEDDDSEALFEDDESEASSPSWRNKPWAHKELSLREAGLRAAMRTRDKICKATIHDVARARDRTVPVASGGGDGNDLQFPLPDPVWLEDLKQDKVDNEDAFDFSPFDWNSFNPTRLPFASPWWTEPSLPSSCAVQAGCNFCAGEASSRTMLKGWGILGLGGAGRRVVEALCSLSPLPEGLLRPNRLARALICDDDPLPRFVTLPLVKTQYVCAQRPPAGIVVCFPSEVLEFVDYLRKNELGLCVIAGAGGVWAGGLDRFLSEPRRPGLSEKMKLEETHPRTLAIILLPVLASSLLPVSSLEPYDTLLAVGDVVARRGTPGISIRFIDNASLLRSAHEGGLRAVNTVAAQCVLKALQDEERRPLPKLTAVEQALHEALSQGLGSKHRTRNAYSAVGICKRLSLEGSQTQRRQTLLSTAASLSKKTGNIVRFGEDDGDLDSVWMEVPESGEELESVTGPLLPKSGGPLLAIACNQILRRMNSIFCKRSWYHWIVACGLSEDSIPIRQHFKLLHELSNTLYPEAKFPSISS